MGSTPVDAKTAPPLRFGAAETALLATVSVVWGAAYVFIRYGIEVGASPLLYAAARYLLTAVAFAAIAAVRRDALPDRRAFLVSAGIGGVLIVGLYGGLLYWGEQYTTGGYAAVLASCAPLMTVGMGYLLLASERLGPRGLLGMGVGFAGALVLVGPEILGSPVGSWQGPLFVLAAMLSMTFGSVLLRRVGRGPQGIWQLATQFGVAGGLLSAASALVPVPERLPWSTDLVATLAALVALSSVLGYFVYFTLHHRVGPIRANLVAYIVPVVGVAIGSGLYGETFTVWELAGVAIVLAGVTLVLRDSAGAARSPPKPSSTSRLPTVPE